MQEVVAQLRFTKECLGYASRQLRKGPGVIYRMPRDGCGHIIFLATWWRERFDFAAKLLNVCVDLVPKLVWDPVVVGRPHTWKRRLPEYRQKSRGRASYALHEAFRPRDIIECRAVLPDGVTIEVFAELLTVVGTYRGISPFQANDITYGTFEVVSVQPVTRGGAHAITYSAVRGPD